MIRPETYSISEITKLICLPFSGGSVYSYKTFEKLAPPFLKLVPLELPGRGQRVREPLLRDMNLIVDDIFSRIRSELTPPYAIYGHSMGSVLGYLLTKKILAEGITSPLHLFFTGCKAPGEPDRERFRYKLPKREFIEKIRAMGGSMDSVLDDEVTMQFFEPILRADFEATECFEYSSSEPFQIPITVVNGTHENITDQEALGWQRETTSKFEFRKLSGDHFFIFQHERELLDLISSTIKKHLIASAHERNIEISQA